MKQLSNEKNSKLQLKKETVAVLGRDEGATVTQETTLPTACPLSYKSFESCQTK